MMNKILPFISIIISIISYHSKRSRFPLKAKPIEEFVLPNPELYFPIELPQDIMMEIGKRLPSRLDILWFRSVCKGWRKSLPFPNQFPLSVPPPPNCDPIAKYFITEVTLYIIRGPNKRFRVNLEEMGYGNGKFHGIYAGTKNIPFDKPMTWLMDPKESKIRFGCKGHRVRKEGKGRWDELVNKMVLISSKNVGGLGIQPSYSRVSDMSAFALLMNGRLAVLRLHGYSKDWFWDTSFCNSIFKAICSYRGELCVLDTLGQVFMVDYHSLHMTKIGPPLEFLPCANFRLCTTAIRYPQKELYECNGLLHAVDCEQYHVGRRTIGYTLSLQHSEWIPIVQCPRKRGYVLNYIV